LRYLLDTNVLSEPARPEPDANVLQWLDSQSQIDLAISVLTLGEIANGIERLVPGSRRERLQAWLEVDLPRRFRDRVLPLDERCARQWGRLAAMGQQAGRPLPVIDGLLLATAATYDLTFVTRNESDCADRGVPILNPWR
jgi:predicted nucleic acid-binding protein